MLQIIGMLKWHLVRIEGVRKLADKMMCMRQSERERERERERDIYIERELTRLRQR